MRIIKFRAWDGESMSRYFHLYELEGYEGEVNAVVHNEYGNERKQWTIAENQKKDEKVILMQYVGFNDKNGKEIYESDIVEIDTVGKCRVDYLPAAMKFYFQTLENYIGEFTAESKVIEVVGNIYENPELIKSK